MQLGLTQAEVAEKLGLAHMVYSRLERGKMLPSVQTLLRMCSVLRISSDELLGLADAEEGPKSGKGERGPAVPPPAGARGAVDGAAHGGVRAGQGAGPPRRGRSRLKDHDPPPIGRTVHQ